MHAIGIFVEYQTRTTADHMALVKLLLMFVT